MHDESSSTTHISADVQRITLNASCTTISGERTEQLYIFCRIAGFRSDFLSFIVVEHIRFFHGALQLCLSCRPAYIIYFILLWYDGACLCAVKLNTSKPTKPKEGPECT